MQTIYDLLQQEHDKVRNALQTVIETTEAAEKTRADILKELREDLDRHHKFEEQHVYKRFLEVKADDEAKCEVDDGKEEHREAEGLLQQMADLDVSSPDFAAKAKELKDALEHHFHDEEDEMFPQAKKVIAEDEAVELARQYRDIKLH